MKYKGNYGCSGCDMPDCYVCRDLKQCPRCGQGDYPIGKHNKCSLCGYQLDIVTYETGWDRPSGDMSMGDEFSKGDDTTRRKE